MNTIPRPPRDPFAPPCDPVARRHIPGAIRFSRLHSHRVRWLWPNRIPLSRITLLASDPGLGKSLVALDVAARVTKAAPWPEEEFRAALSVPPCDESSIVASDRPTNPQSAIRNPQSLFPPPLFPAFPSSVLLLASEDDLADTILPRLHALGADCDRIFTTTTDPEDSFEKRSLAFALDRDLDHLRTIVDGIRDCRLIIIDPITAFLGDPRSHSHAHLQSLLFALNALAREYDLAILIISHLRKKDGAAIYRTMGSLAFVALARAAWAICQDPADHRKRILLPVKNNLVSKSVPLVFTIETGTACGAPTIRWSSEPVRDTFNFAIAPSRSVGRPDEERQYAMNWLRERLSQGPRPVRELRAEADAHGIGYGTLRRAYRQIGAESVRQGPFPRGQWDWKLPSVDAQNPVGELCAPTHFLDQSVAPTQSSPPTSDTPNLTADD